MKEPIAYITDIHLDEQFISDIGVDSRAQWNLILNDVRSKGINRVIFGGDIGELNSNEWFFDSLKDFSLDITLGNHDTFAEAKKYFRTPHLKNTNGSELFYSFENGAFKYIFLDSSLGVVSNDQLTWLINQLQVEKDILLFLHHPILTVDTNAEAYWPLKGREKLRSVLRHHSNSITIFCGHFHTDDDQTDKNLHQIMTPAASYQMRKNPGAIDIPGATITFSTPDGGSTWNPLSESPMKISHDHTNFTVNTTTFGYRIITINDNHVDTELRLYKDKQFQTVKKPDY